ncbi:MAG: heparinase II/III family protein [Lachnospiraceae bacterium]|nr:heparinase II/III family protein [Lachnospiraceae bacterium]
MTVREELKQQIDQAYALLKETEGYTTEQNRFALKDMIAQAERALDGTGKVPFTRKREFLNPRPDEACCFALERYTMVSTFLTGRSVYNTYGLKGAIDWFRSTDLRLPLPASEVEAGAEGMLSEKEKVDFYRDQCREFLDRCVCGTEIGQYGKAKKDALEAALKKLDWLEQSNRTGQMHSIEQTEIRKGSVGQAEIKKEAGVQIPVKEQMAAALTDCVNCLQELRFSRVLRSDMDTDSSLLLTAKQMEALRHKVESDPIAAGEYRKIQEIADRVTLETRKEAYETLFCADDYEAMNRQFHIWGSAGNPPSFTAPEGSCEAVLTLRLPSEDNEADGLGHIWITNLSIRSSAGPNLAIINGDFSLGKEIPEGWKPVAKKGNPILKTERKAMRPKTDSILLNPEKTGNCLYLCNPTSEDEGVWEQISRIPVQDDAMYTMQFEAKQDGKFCHGLEVAMTFFNSDGQKTGTHTFLYNRKSWLDVKKYNLYAQCDAICYWYTKDITYAEKAKIEIFHFLDDFLQGAEHWLVKNSRPEGSDAYGAVQGGRDMFALACAYSLIRNSGVFSKEDKERFYRLIDYFLRYLSDLRDRMTLSPERAQRFTSNWQTDMCIGTAAMMIVLPDFPNRKTWIYNAEAVLRAQLQLKVNPDGSWPESIRYHHATLEHFGLYGRIWLLESGENWFETTRLLDLFGYSLNTQTPPYDYYNKNIATPPFGDHKLGDGSEFSIFGLYCELIAGYDKAIADRMYETWCLAKKPVKGLWGESMALENLMYVTENGYQTEPGFSLKLESTGAFSDAGIYLFRKNYGTQKQNYLAVMSSPRKVGHGHLDQGAFILYYHGVPVIMDSGIEGYFDSTTPWHLSSYSHAVMQFATGKRQFEKQKGGFINLTAGTYSLERGWSDGPDCSRVTELSIGGMQEQITMEIENPEGKGLQTRTIQTDHETETWLVTDQVTGFEGMVLFNLPLLMKSARVEGNTILAEGWYGVNITIYFETEIESIWLEEGRATPMDPGAKDCSMLIYVRATAKAANGFRVRICPQEEE